MDEQALYIKGILGFLKRKKEMVAGAYDYHAFVIGDAYFLYPVIGSRAFYLYAFLKLRKDTLMTKKIILSVFTILLLCVILCVFKESGSNRPLSIIRGNGLENESSADSNILVFRVNYLGMIPAGEARLENKGIEFYQGRSVYHLSAQANPLNFYSKFFKAQAQTDSYIDADKLCTLKFEQILLLPNKPEDKKEILYDQNNNFMELRGVRRHILPGTQDPLSAIFYIRHQNLEIGKVFDININTNQKNYQLYAKVIGREEYALRTKKVGVWVVEGVLRRRDKSRRRKPNLNCGF